MQPGGTKTWIRSFSQVNKRPESSEAGSVSIAKVVLPKQLSEKQKRSQLTPSFNDIMYLVSRSKQPVYEQSLSILKKLQSDLRQGKMPEGSISDDKTSEADKSNELVGILNNLSIEDQSSSPSSTGLGKKNTITTTADHSTALSNVNLPTPMKVIGRLSKSSMRCTPNMKKTSGRSKARK